MDKERTFSAKFRWSRIGRLGSSLGVVVVCLALLRLLGPGVFGPGEGESQSLRPEVVEGALVPIDAPLIQSPSASAEGGLDASTRQEDSYGDLVQQAAGARQPIGREVASERELCVIAGTVSNQAGNPVEGAAVWLDFMGGDRSDPVRSDGNGYYELTVLRNLHLMGPPPMRVAASASGYLAQAVSLHREISGYAVNEDRREVPIVLSTAKSHCFTITLVSGEPAIGAMLTLEPKWWLGSEESGSLASSLSGRAGEDGRVVIDGLPPAGIYIAEVGLPRLPHWLRFPIDVNAPLPDQITVPDPYSLTIQFDLASFKQLPFPCPGASVAVALETKRVEGMHTPVRPTRNLDGKGLAKFEGLRYGDVVEVRLHCGDSGHFVITNGIAITAPDQRAYLHCSRAVWVPSELTHLARPTRVSWVLRDERGVEPTSEQFWPNTVYGIACTWRKAGKSGTQYLRCEDDSPRLPVYGMIEIPVEPPFDLDFRSRGGIIRESSQKVTRDWQTVPLFVERELLNAASQALQVEGYSSAGPQKIAQIHLRSLETGRDYFALNKHKNNLGALEILLPEGCYRYAAVGWYSERVYGELTVTEAPHQRIQIQIQGMGVLTGSWAPLRGGVELLLLPTEAARSFGDHAYSTYPAPDGTFTFVDVAAGEYTLAARVTKDGRRTLHCAERTFQVQAQKITTIAAVAPELATQELRFDAATETQVEVLCDEAVVFSGWVDSEDSLKAPTGRRLQVFALQDREQWHGRLVCSLQQMDGYWLAALPRK